MGLLSCAIPRASLGVKTHLTIDSKFAIVGAEVNRALHSIIFYRKDSRFVKQTQKTPVREIEQAKRELADYLERNEDS